jgi:hypothetical protein
MPFSTGKRTPHPLHASTESAPPASRLRQTGQRKMSRRGAVTAVP